MRVDFDIDMVFDNHRGKVSLGCIIMPLVHVTHAKSLSSFQYLQIACLETSLRIQRTDFVIQPWIKCNVSDPHVEFPGPSCSVVNNPCVSADLTRCFGIEKRFPT